MEGTTNLTNPTNGRRESKVMGYSLWAIGEVVNWKRRAEAFKERRSPNRRAHAGAMGSADAQSHGFSCWKDIIFTTMEAQRTWTN